MDSNSIALDFKKPLDLKKIASKVASLKFVDGSDVLAADVGALKIIIFPNGLARITMPGGDYKALGTEMSKAGFQVGKLLEEVNSAAGVGADVGALMRGMTQEDVGYDYLQGMPFKSIRKSLGEKVDLRILLASLAGAAQVTGDFQVARINSQAGELMGRALVRTAKPKSQAELVQMVAKSLEDTGLGKPLSSRQRG